MEHMILVEKYYFIPIGFVSGQFSVLRNKIDVIILGERF